MPLKLSSLWRRLTVQKSTVKPFIQEDVAESAPSSPRHHGIEAEVSRPRPASHNEEIRPRRSPSILDTENIQNSASDCALPEQSVRPTQTNTTVASAADTVIRQPCGGYVEPSPKQASGSVSTDAVSKEFKFSRDNDLAEAIEGYRPVKANVVNDPASANTNLVEQATSDQIESVTVKFGAPLNDVVIKVAEEFGQITSSSLRSAKWDKRVQALKAMGTVLKGLELGSATEKPSAIKGLRLRDRSSCWRTVCQVLNYSICDKVIPVRLASHDLFCEAFRNTNGIPEEEVGLAVGILLGHILPGLGDSNLRLHESSRKCVLLCAELSDLLGLKAILALLHTRLETNGKSRERVKLHFGILDTVSFLLRSFPHSNLGPEFVTEWSSSDIVPFVTAGMDDALGPRVRSIAVQLAVTLRATFGPEAMEPILADFRPAVKTLLREKFAELQEEDSIDNEDDGSGPEGNFFIPSANDMQGLVICGSGIRAPESKPPFAMPGAIEADEDVFMDTILEETGNVFRSGGHEDRVQELEEKFLSYIGDEEELMDVDFDVNHMKNRAGSKRRVSFSQEIEANFIEVF